MSDISLAHLETRKSIVQQGSTAAVMLAALSRKWSGYTESDLLSTVYPANQDPHRCFLGRCSTEMLSWINSALMDTGANVRVFNSSVEQSKTHSTNSRLKIQVADTNYMMRRRDGLPHMLFINPATGNYANGGNTFAYKVTSVKNLAKDLFSIDDLFTQQNFNVCLRQPSYENGISEMFRPPTKDSEAKSIPLRYDYQYGGFYVDYILPSKNETDYEYQKSMFSARYKDHLQCTKLAGDDVLFGDDQVVTMVSRAFDSDAVTEVVFGQHEDSIMRNIRGVEAGLRKRKRQLTVK